MATRLSYPDRNGVIDRFGNTRHVMREVPYNSIIDNNKYGIVLTALFMWHILIISLVIILLQYLLDHILIVQLLV